MEPPDDFDDFLDDIEPMTPQEQYEMLLRYVSATVDVHTSVELEALRAHLLRTLPEDEHRATMLEVIEGKIALREIAKE
jgi:hypothetical protein